MPRVNGLTYVGKNDQVLELLLSRHIPSIIFFTKNGKITTTDFDEIIAGDPDRGTGYDTKFLTPSWYPVFDMSDKYIGYMTSNKGFIAVGKPKQQNILRRCKHAIINYYKVIRANGIHKPRNWLGSLKHRISL